MKLVLDRQNLTLCGRFDHFGSKDALTLELRRGGATVTKGLGARTTAVIIGAGWNVTRERAEQRGLPVLTEAQAIELLERGELELEEDAEPDAPLDALIGEARAALDGEPDVASWRALVDLLDRCSLDQQPALADYLVGPLGRWEQPRQARFMSPELVGDFSPQWLRRAPPGELRVAPPGWVREACTGQPLPKHALARAVILTTLQHSNRELVAMLSGGSFSNLERLDLGASGRAKVSQGVFRALAQSAAAARLSHLRLTAFDDVHVGALSVDSPLAPDELTLMFYTLNYSIGALRELMSSSWVQRLSGVVLESLWPEHALDVTRALAPYMRHIERFVIDTLGGFRGAQAILPVAPPCPTLELRGAITRARPGDASATLTHRLAPGTEHLDVSGLLPDPLSDQASVIRATMRESFFALLPTTPITAGITSITLGEWRTEELAERFDARGVEVVG